MNRHHFRAGWAGVLGTLILTGCDSTPAADKSTTEAKVAGSVTVKGARMSGGEVVFTPVGGARETGGSRTVPVKFDGSYEVTTLVGKNDVRIQGAVLKKEPTLGYVTKTVDVQPSGTVAHLEFP